jgi:hypothetical protein
VVGRRRLISFRHAHDQAPSWAAETLPVTMEPCAGLLIAVGPQECSRRAGSLSSAQALASERCRQVRKVNRLPQILAMNDTFSFTQVTKEFQAPMKIILANPRGRAGVSIRTARASPSP